MKKILTKRKNIAFLLAKKMLIELKMRNIVFLMSLLIFFNAAYGELNRDQTNDKIYPYFNIIETEFAPGKYLKNGDSKNLQKHYDFKRLPNTMPVLNRMITLTADLFPSGFILSESLYLYLPPTEYPLKIFLNGNMIHERGNEILEKGYVNRIHYAESIMLPAAFFERDKKTELVIQIYPREGETSPFPEVFIAHSKIVKSEVFLKNFFGPKLIQSLVIVCFFIFIYCLFLFFFKKGEQEVSYLYFALINLFFITAYLNNIFSNDIFPIFPLEKLSRVSFVLLTFFSILFTLEFTGIFKKIKKKLIFSVLWIGIFLCAVLISKKDTLSLSLAFGGWIAIVILIGLTANVFLVAIAYKRDSKEKKYLVLTVIYILHIFFVLYDAYYFSVLQKKPFVMMIPFTSFLINLGMIWLLAKQQIQTEQDLRLKTKELKELNENLEKTILDRTRELRESNDTRDKFFSIIAHDLRGPIGSFKTMMDLIPDLKDADAENTKEIFSLLKKSSKNTYSLLDNLLAWARSQKNEILVEPTEINLKKLMEENLNIMDMIFKEKKIQVNCMIPENLKIYADFNMIHLVLRNLLSNAVKFSYERGVLEIRANEDNDFVWLIIKDHGIGIAPDIMPILFQIGRNKQQAGTLGEKGSGLGLILCREFMEKNGGLIEVFSVADQGTIFTLKFPKNRMI